MNLWTHLAHLSVLIRHRRAALGTSERQQMLHTQLPDANIVNVIVIYTGGKVLRLLQLLLHRFDGERVGRKIREQILLQYGVNQLARLVGAVSLSERLQQILAEYAESSGGGLIREGAKIEGSRNRGTTRGARHLGIQYRDQFD